MIRNLLAVAMATTLTIDAFAEDEQSGRVKATMADAPAIKGSSGFLSVTKGKDEMAEFCKSRLADMPPGKPATFYLVVSKVLPDTPAEKAEIQRDDVVAEIAGIEINSSEALDKARARVIAGREVQYLIRRLTPSGKKNKWKTMRVTLTPVPQEQIQAMVKEREKQLPPLVITGVGITNNVIGIPELNIEVHNIRSSQVLAYEVEIECFTKFDEPVTWPGKGNLQRGISQRVIEPKQKQRGSWTLNLHGTTAKAKVWISRVKLGDESVWTQTRNEAEQGDWITDARKLD